MTMTLLQPSSAAATAALTAINSFGATTAGSVNAQETDTKKGKQPHHLEDIKQDQTAADLTNSAPSSIVKKQSTALMKPDIGILSKDFLKNKGRAQPVGQQFAIHRKKRASAADVDAGILSNGQQQTSRANRHAMNEVTGRSLQNEEELPPMCPIKNQIFNHGLFFFDRLFDKTDGYFPKCSCPSPTTCGSQLCECLELDANGDIFQCMDPFKQLCEGAKYIDGIPGPWSMEECLGSKLFAINYCTMLPCFVDGGSYVQCRCNKHDRRCTESRDKFSCAASKCCQAQTDDDGRVACLDGDLHENYYDEVISRQEMISRFNECAFNSGDDKSIVECYCESFSYQQCVNFGVVYPDQCEAMNCCYGETEDDARLDCFTRFRDRYRTGFEFYHSRDTIEESCVASGRSSDQCKCDIQGLSNCVVGNRCDLFQCCQSQTGDDDDGRKDCLVQDEAQLMYIDCINEWWIYSNEFCYCDKSNKLCSSGHSNDRHCKLSSCCREQADDTGLKECIDNFTTSQPSSASSGITPAEDSIDEAETSPTAASPGASSTSISTRLGAKSLSKATSKMLAVTLVIGWLLFS